MERKGVFCLVLIGMASMLSVCMAAQKVNVAILANSDKEAAAYSRLIDRFHLAHPDYEVVAHFASDARYKAHLDDWLRSGEVDVLYWQAGKRLFTLVEGGLVMPLDDVWSGSNLQSQFHPGLSRLVTHKGQVFGIPFSYYHWGLFYNKTLFEALGISEPSSFTELLKACERMTSAAIPAVGLGAKEKWPLLGWFDYFDLRVNGYDFHNQLVKGKASFTSPQVRRVFETWHTFLTACPVNPDFRRLDWDIPVVSMSRQRVGMVLVGNFMQQLFPEHLLKDIGFFPFPSITEQRTRSEAAPTEVWILSSHSMAKAHGKSFLSFVAKTEQLHLFNADIGYISPDNDYADTTNALTQEGVEMLQRATNIIQYFDRDAPDALVAAASDILLEFVEDKDIDKAMKRLESARLALKRE